MINDKLRKCIKVFYSLKEVMREFAFSVNMLYLGNKYQSVLVYDFEKNILYFCSIGLEIHYHSRVLSRIWKFIDQQH